MACYLESTAVTNIQNSITECDNNIAALTEMANNANEAAKNFNRAVKSLQQAKNNCKKCMTMDGMPIDADKNNPGDTAIGNQIEEKGQWMDQAKKIEKTLRDDIRKEKNTLASLREQLIKANNDLTECHRREEEAARAAEAANNKSK